MNRERIHGPDAAIAGDVGPVHADEQLGPCPSCAAEICAAMVRNPHTGKVGRAMLHPMPFCTYFGVTDPAEIETEIERRKS
jgi:hypothetical protein